MKSSNGSGLITGFMLFFFCLNISVIKAQSVAFSGFVLNKAGQPLENVHVLLNETHYHAVTDSSGSFSIKDLTPGSYSLTIRSVGYQAYKKSITIPSGGLHHFSAVLQTRLYTSNAVVITATRTRKALEDVSVPMTVIDDKQIENTGSMRLSDILAEQTGLRLVGDHGVGIQVQGFSSDYTLIMINGQPLIGRRAGTLDLSRITVGNVKQIEMIKGPSSALWGSHALAGVINIITEKAQQPFSLELTSRYGTHQTLDAGANLSWKIDNWSNTFFINRNSSGGYRLVPSSITQTVPDYRNYTASYRTSIDISDRVEAGFYGRYYHESQDIASFLGEANDPTMLDIDATLQNYGINPSLRVQLTDNLELEVNHFLSGYKTERNLFYESSGDLYEQSLYDQTYNKSELKATQVWNSNHISTLGSGLSREQLNSDRYNSDTNLNTFFIYGQHDWLITPRLNVIGGFRYDRSNEYGSQLSPKFSAQYKVTDWLHVRASVGSGFKAPAFRHLFLSFTNPSVGYSVLGAANVVERIKEMQAQGKIERLLVPLEQLGNPINAEQSWAYNAGLELYPTSKLHFRVNLFRNNVTDLIESAPIAIKTNGQSA